ncbi:hypothetical protein PYCCODRAFT_1466778 [Trametes coccinea BRFM310]|uniref:DEAD-box helicase OB fold domain-containing protein n=1 Tax=Trametes coccinea (strain BRFM310) TaxID=1353009 RepID=A0A1Y2IQM6_TRAC3|nr:hypothetical protein PYCCODRAFT_1466778 [Trametes coccinea BRFM310]
MERFDLPIVTKIYNSPTRQYDSIRKALICGFFTQVAHKEGHKGTYVTVKDHQQVAWLHPSTVLDHSPEWVLFDECTMTTKSYFRP